MSLEKIKEKVEKAFKFLSFRRQSYQHTFNPESIYANAVLKDLAKFCRANETTFHPDNRTHAVLEGRREVWLRIQQHLQLSENQLWELYGPKN